MDDRSGPARRRLLGLLAAAAGAVVAGAGGLPLVGSLLSPLRRRGEDGPGFVPVARLSALPEGQAVRVAVVAARRDAWWREPGATLGAAWLVRRGADVLAFSATCPHLGCQIEAGAGAEGGSGPTWRCPCHGSAFGPGGEVRGGPSPRGLDLLEVRLSAGPDPQVAVRWQRFAAGTAERRRA